MLETGDRIGDYKLEKFLGRGQFGEVWLAQKQLQLSTRKFCHALKFLSNLGDEINIKAAEAEIDTWIEASGHPNVMSVLDMLIYKDHIVIVSEFAESGSLKTWLESNGGKAPSNEMAVKMMRGILHGIEHLHSRNIVHRDLKPANILLQGNFPRITDFGISRIILNDLTLTQAITGSPIYMAPEAFLGSKSPQTDIWSAGIILYQMLTGTHPFSGETIYALKDAIHEQQPLPLSENVPSQLQQVVYKALEKDRSNRYQTAREMNAALKNIWAAIENEERLKREWEIEQDRLRAEAERTNLQRRLEEAEEIATQERWKREEAERRRQTEVNSASSEKDLETLPISTLRHSFTAQLREREYEEIYRRILAAKANEIPAAVWRFVIVVGSLFFVTALTLFIFIFWSKNNPSVVNTNTAGNTESAETVKAGLLANQALNEMMLGNGTKGKDLATSALQSNRDLPLALAISGWAKHFLGNKKEDYQAARTDLERAAQLEPRNALFHARLAFIYDELKEKELADKEASEVTSLLDSPETALDYYVLGISKRHFEKWDEAISNFTKAIELNPQFVLAFSNRGSIYDKKKDYDSAISDYTRAIALNSQFSSAYSSRGFTLLEKKDYAAAISDYTKAIELNPQNAGAYLSRGIVYNEQRDKDSAIRDYTKAIELNPQFAAAYTIRGSLHNEKKDFTSALKDFTKAIEIEPEFADAYNGRGSYYFGKKDYAAAINDFTKVIELDPQYKIGYYNLGIAYDEKKKYDAAISDYTKAIEIDSQYVDAYFNRGFDYYEKKDYIAAIADYTRVIELDSQNANAFNNRSLAYDKIKRKDSAAADRRMYAKLKRTKK